MVQIIDRPKGTGERFAQAFGNAGQVLPSLLGEQQENKAIERLTGQDVTGLSPDMKKQFLSGMGKGDGKSQEKMQQLNQGLGTIQQMRQRLGSAGPSQGPASFFGQIFGKGDTARTRSELASFGRSLIPLVASGVTIRNQKEFEEYSKIITEPGSTQAELEGALNALEEMIQREMGISPSAQNLQSSQPKQGSGAASLLRLKDPTTGKMYEVSPDKARGYISQGAELVE